MVIPWLLYFQCLGCAGHRQRPPPAMVPPALATPTMRGHQPMLRHDGYGKWVHRWLDNIRYGKGNYPKMADFRLVNCHMFGHLSIILVCVHIIYMRTCTIPMSKLTNKQPPSYFTQIVYFDGGETVMENIPISVRYVSSEVLVLVGPCVLSESCWCLPILFRCFCQQNNLLENCFPYIIFLQKTVFQGNESPLVSVVVLVAMKSRFWLEK